MIVILSDTMKEEEIDFINRIYSKTNEKMYKMSFNILKDKADADEAVTEMFFKMIQNIEKIWTLSHPQIEAHCIIILKDEITTIMKKRKKIVYMAN